MTRNAVFLHKKGKGQDARVLNGGPMRAAKIMLRSTRELVSTPADGDEDSFEESRHHSIGKDTSELLGKVETADRNKGGELSGNG